MKILIDMVHPADVNYYKRTIERLRKDHDITITVFDRARLIDIVNREYAGMRIIPLGRHRKARLEKLVGLVDRMFKFIPLMAREKYDKVSGYGFYPAIASKFLGVPSVLYHDEYEHEISLILARAFGSLLVLPESLGVDGPNIRKFKGFKEVAYLKDLRPSTGALEEYGVKPDGYAFVREVAPITVRRQHYRDIDLAPVMKKLRRKGLRILYYGEVPERKERYKDLVTFVNTPVKDIFALFYHARLIITSGDTITREGALLGTPVVFIGGRSMRVNQPLYDIGAITPPIAESEIEGEVRKALRPGRKKELRARIKHYMDEVWDDTTQINIDTLLE